MTLWGSRKQTGNEPKHLIDDANAEKEVRKARIDGSTPAETAGDKAGHAGWTMPAGGNDNPNAQRECIVCMGSMHGDFLESSSSSSGHSSSSSSSLHSSSSSDALNYSSSSSSSTNAANSSSSSSDSLTSSSSSSSLG